MKIIAREKELAELAKIYNSDKPEFLAIYGRRRIGKTYLIRNYFENKGFFFYMTGVIEGSKKEQLFNFYEEYQDIFSVYDEKVPENWNEAFSRLRKKIEQTEEKKIVIFIDELPWLATHKSGFISALSHLWNRYFSNNPSIKLIICGSAASWIIKNIVNSKGSLHNRLTKQIQLSPFNLQETELYLKEHNIILDKKQIVDIYMAIGGVASYLNYLEPGKSSEQLISEICLSKNNSTLYGEFNRLFKSLFKDYKEHIKIIKILSSKRIGINRKELIEKTQINSGSVLNRILQELIESGFIAVTDFWGNKSKNKKYRLIDEYSLFYLKWNKEITSSKIGFAYQHWITLMNTQSYISWSGFSFESVCYNHIDNIANSLGISGILYSYSSWNYKPLNKEEQGVQIDLLIERPDNIINLCEIKYSKSEFVITKDYAKQLLYKKEKFIEISKTKKTIFITMITPYGIKNNKYKNIANRELTIDDLFV